MSPRMGYTEAPHANRQDWHNIRSLLPYLWDFRGRVLIALFCLLLAKLATVGTPLVLKQLIDRLDVDMALGIPLGLLAAYGGLRMANTLFSELRDALFAKVRYQAMRRLTVRTLAHLHSLSLRFHLERKTGSINRDLQRGAASLSTLLNYLTFNILPIAIELMLVLGILISHYDAVFTLIVLVSVAIYVVFTLAITNWRMEFRHRMNRLDSKANNEAVDSLINFETVKYFTNEDLEVKRYDATLQQWEHSAVLSQTSMSALNFGQGAIIAVGVTLVMFFATSQVLAGAMSLGDLVMVNAFLLQLFLPLNFLGVVYRQIRYSLADMDLLVKLLAEQPEIQDRPAAVPLRDGPGELRFEQVDFSYQQDRLILSGVDFTVKPGQKVAVVGASGAGKSTLARLLFRFYDVDRGRILLDGQDIREVQQHSLRAAIGIVPQDTVLFNDTLYFNLQYANPRAHREEIIAAARLAQLHDFVMSLAQGYETVVGERGLKLSGGEKQRVAIARALLKKPRILVFDEATSALDSAVEQAILQALQRAAAGHTTLAIAHRLSTIVDADQILVLQGGRIIERGTHQELLVQNGAYARLWLLQQKDREMLTTR